MRLMLVPIVFVIGCSFDGAGIPRDGALGAEAQGLRHDLPSAARDVPNPAAEGPAAFDDGRAESGGRFEAGAQEAGGLEDGVPTDLARDSGPNDTGPGREGHRDFARDRGPVADQARPDQARPDQARPDQRTTDCSTIFAAPDAKLCSVDAGRCVVYAQLNSRSCTAFCHSASTQCVTSHDEGTGKDPCKGMATAKRSCDDTSKDRVCICEP